MILNNMFNTRTIKRLCGEIKIVSEQEKAAKNWIKKLKNNELEKESQNYDKFQQIILEDILGYERSEIQKASTGVEEPDFFLKGELEMMLAIEAKGTLTEDLFAKQYRDDGAKETPIKQATFYKGKGFINAICTNYKKFILVGKNDTYYIFDFMDINSNDGLNITKLKEFVGVFSKQNLINKNMPQLLIEESQKEQKEISDEFYELFHETRVMLMLTIEKNKDHPILRSQAVYYSQIILNRLIFIFFAEDMGFVKNNTLFRDAIIPIINAKPTTQSKDVYNFIRDKLFVYFDKGNDELDICSFNGNLFSSSALPPHIWFPDLDDGKYTNILNKHGGKFWNYDQIVEKTITSCIGLNPIIKNLLKMESYDFKTDLGVNILGHIFEQSISDLELLMEGKNIARKDNGIFYTPEYITTYICQNTIIPYLSKSGEATTINDLMDEYIRNDDVKTLQLRCENLKILDPACGSGAFLVKAIDILLEINMQIHKHEIMKKLFEKNITESLDDWIREDQARLIIERNIYGIDLNPQAVAIAKLSMFFKLATKCKKLPDLSNTIHNGNSIISGTFDDGFDWSEKFSNVMKNGGFDLIIGNPPYVRHENIQYSKNMIQVPKNNKLNDVEFEIDRKSDLSVYFYHHALHYLKNYGKIGFITSAGWVNTVYGQQLQNILLEKCNIEILMRTEFNVFDDANIKTITTILEKNEKYNSNLILIYIKKWSQLLDASKHKKIISQLDLKIGNWNHYFDDNHTSPKIPMKTVIDFGLVKRGITTGYDNFFILSVENLKKYNMPLRYRKPTLSLDNNDGILEQKDGIEYLLNVNESKKELQQHADTKDVLEYIISAENDDVVPIKGSDRSPRKTYELTSLISRKPYWYSLNLKNDLPIILTRFIHDRIKVFENNGSFQPNGKYACFSPKNIKYIRPFLAYFKSSYFSLYQEKNGRISGGGLLQFAMEDYKQSPVPDLDQLSDKSIEKLEKAWNNYCEDFDQKKLDDDVLSILGFDQKQKINIETELKTYVNNRQKKNKKH